MPVVDEAALRQLLKQATADIHAPSLRRPAGSSRVRVRRQIAAGVAAAVAIGLVTAEVSSNQTPSTVAGNVEAAHATPSQRILYQLASVSFSAPAARESASGPAGAAPFTASQLAALPTNPPALRRAFIANADRAKVDAALEVVEAQAKSAAAAVVARAKAESKTLAAASPDDEVFRQASDVLSDPRTRPVLRATVYRLLATTPDVTVTPLMAAPGQPVVRISALTGAVSSILVSPVTGAVIPPLTSPLGSAPSVSLPPLAEPA